MYNCICVINGTLKNQRKQHVTTKHQTTKDKKTKELAKNMVKYLLIQMHDKLKFNLFFPFLEIKGNMQKFINS